MSIKKYKYTQSNRFKIEKFKTNDKSTFSSREDAVEEFVANLKEIHALQQRLYAERKESVIFIFQAMDAAGKDGAIRTVFSTLSPHGVKEFCFKAPSTEELAHDYLWRFWSALPAKGHISIFNRSYYEDVLVGKVHKLYENQPVPDRLKDVDVIQKRYDEINSFEKYLYNNGTRVVKIFLNVSKKEQAKRFISRIDTPSKNWKISEGDIKEREYWDEYQEAFQSMINNTSSKNSPWYVVPADHKWYARLIISRIVLNTLKEINPQFPTVAPDEMEKIQKYREELINSLDKKPKKVKNKPNDKIKDENKTNNDNSSKSNETFTVDQKNIDLEDVDNMLKNQEEAFTLNKKENKKNTDKKSKSKHKKNKKKQKENNEEKQKAEKENNKNENIVKKEDSEENHDDESVFFDASIIVTDNIIEEEQAKILEKEEIKLQGENIEKDDFEDNKFTGIHLDEKDVEDEKLTNITDNSENKPET